MAWTRLSYYWSILFAGIAICYTVQAKLVDLTHDIDADTVMAVPDWPRYQTNIVFEGDISSGVYAKAMSYSVSEHGGTHMDAPRHFNKDGYSMEQIPLENTIADGIMIDCTDEVAKDPSYSLTLQKIKDWEKANGEIPQNSAVVVNCNWSHKFNNATLYLNPTNASDLTDASTFRFPSVSEEAIDFLVDERDINMLAMDTMSPDLMNSAFPVHVKLCTRNKLIIENVKDPGQLPTKGFRFHASPAKFVGGTGIQTRVYAMIYEDEDDDDDDDDEVGRRGGCQNMGYSIAATIVALIAHPSLRLFTLL